MLFILRVVYDTSFCLFVCFVKRINHSEDRNQPQVVAKCKESTAGCCCHTITELNLQTRPWVLCQLKNRSLIHNAPPSSSNNTAASRRGVQFLDYATLMPKNRATIFLIVKTNNRAC